MNIKIDYARTTKGNGDDHEGSFRAWKIANELSNEAFEQKPDNGIILLVILLLNIFAVRSFSLVNLTFNNFGSPSYLRVEFSVYHEMNCIFLLL